MELKDNRWYPSYHVAAPAGWINDPNGLCYFDGRYHVFFQYHPHSVEWGPMHWGHVSSSDLVTWRHEPIALAPSIEEDRDGCWSGSCVVGDDGRLYAFYTGHCWRTDPNDPNSRRQVQCLAVSDDGIHFQKHGSVLENPQCPTHFRDPKVWREGETWCMVVGQQSPEKRGQVALYTSDDLLHWNQAGIVYEYPDANVYMLECPDLFELDGKWVLCFSAMGMRPSGYMGRNQHNAGYLVGSWKLGEPFVPQTEFAPCDAGHNYYAPQSFEHEGRRIQFGWMSSFHMGAAEQEDGWCGQLTLPRKLSLRDDGVMLSMPVPECAMLWEHAQAQDSSEVTANEERVIADDLACGCLELTFDLAASSAERFGVKLHGTTDGNYLFVGYDAQTGCVVVDRQGCLRGHRGYRAARVYGDSLRLQIWLDRGSIEVFVNDGEVAFSEMSYPGDGPRSITLTSEQGITKVEKLTLSK